MSFCPCGSKKEYTSCCGIFHSGKELPSSPELLMRSRYCAFVLKNAPYLFDTLHPQFREEGELQKIERAFANTKWIALHILNSGITSPNLGYVEFSAIYEENQIGELHECSNFIFEQNRWFYTNGKQLPPLKWQRNDPCWCGSGKKLKKCHP